MDQPAVLPLDDYRADLATVGGKGASLARLTRAGLPVSPGFHVTTHAFRTGTVPAAEIAAAYAALGGGPVAVRSSATAEDLPELSFAGQHDTFLDVTGTEAVTDAVARCWASLWTERAVAYRARNGIPEDGLALAVVVQRMVPAEVSGVLFTANPVTGARDETVIDAAPGLGDTLVGGEVTPDTAVVSGGRVTSRTNPLLDEARALELAALGRRIEELYGLPVDVEWALHDGRVAVLQARPVTTMRESWNDSLLGDYMWTSANLGEGIPSVMTPATWSVALPLIPPPVGPHPTAGRIGGRYYLNLSTALAAGAALGLGRLVRRANEATLGPLPPGVEVPPLPMSRAAIVLAAVRAAVPMVRASAVYRRRLPELVAANPAHCRALRERIAVADADGLRALWRSEVAVLLRERCPAFEAGARSVLGGHRLAARLRRLVGDQDATALLTGLHGAGDSLESLGPVLGLAAVRRGTLSRAEFVAAWGHRGPDEFELSAPRPAEDPGWLDRQLTAEQGTDPEELLARQAEVRAAAWRRLESRHPRKAPGLRRALARAAASGRNRERARSEFVRSFWVFRAFFLRAAELTGEDTFFLSVDETLALLGGDRTAAPAIQERRARYERYRALPPYPTFIRGRFDPESWAAGDDRRGDVWDETATPPPADDAIAGHPGGAGVVTGTARVVSTVEEAEALRPGEVLVAPLTNVGWTPLFPRAAAVVTDVGAPLSHAAIVARELGIPAVVGCGNATTRIRTGDRVRVDGAAGTVVPLHEA
ncbi:PEP/pyruvate-binding domain-containing protein [Actinophytocola gossypii]|uniref:Pyruvate, phosphate dikinase n=1 Tax=Actinophytocola gossypii TaxID=2812003 RepID=A0ABT2J8V8_9PSEU|nr:PEP/pyruvate-binding domain-containing protein [Actinophytocola gossypii]MCT2584295.1 pyruvate, phosphate dikinase [Actinophytocola gossypii]